MTIAAAAPGLPRQLGRSSIPLRIGSLSALLLGALLVSVTFMTLDLIGTQRRVEEANARFHRLELAAEAQHHFEQMRYWLTDLSVSLLTLSERRADEALAALEADLQAVEAFAPEAARAIREGAATYRARASGGRRLHGRQSRDRQQPSGSGAGAQRRGGRGVVGAPPGARDRGERGACRGGERGAPGHDPLGDRRGADPDRRHRLHGPRSPLDPRAARPDRPVDVGADGGRAGRGPAAGGGRQPRPHGAHAAHAPRQPGRAPPAGGGGGAAAPDDPDRDRDNPRAARSACRSSVGPAKEATGWSSPSATPASHDRGAAGEIVPGLRAGRQLDHPELRRHGAGPGHHAALRAHDGRRPT